MLCYLQLLDSARRYDCNKLAYFQSVKGEYLMQLLYHFLVQDRVMASCLFRDIEFSTDMLILQFQLIFEQKKIIYFDL